ncbi:unnamed protein product [Bursaphelenchus xylophilus]|uniref:(pine wood nematode) hypothetical protein n=1 Tax=Bursaphelenchus xylophilus TaxID=6326 RepID=A0A1I7RVS6_BURXY|nr:unnamed protein product [Bursaphelenchus xylophilus]CAG9082118.1 unnamed protein product [Bursaphelenchus xylophilus]
MLRITYLCLLLAFFAVTESRKRPSVHWEFSGYAKCDPHATDSPYLIEVSFYSIGTFYTTKCGSAIADKTDGSFHIECEDVSFSAYPEVQIRHGCGGYCLYYARDYSEHYIDDLFYSLDGGSGDLANNCSPKQLIVSNSINETRSVV